MKRFGTLFLAAIIGSVVTLGFYYWLGNSPPYQEPNVHYSNNGLTPKNIAYTENDAGELVPLDFTEASKIVMDAVVHIRSTQEVQQAQRRQFKELPDPFRDYFGQDFFRRYFGPGQEGGESAPPQRRMGAGSGVILNTDGYIVTNNHVIANADEIQVTLHDNRTYQATVLGADPLTDLALLKIDEHDIPYLSLENSDDIQVGEWVLAVGNPFNLTSTVTAGIVSAKGRNINIMREQYAIESFIQTDAAINPGNSGGALVTLNGGLIGINTAIASPTGAYSGYGFAIPSNIVGKIVEDIIEYGTVQRAYLGVQISNIDGNFAREQGLQVTEGVYVDSVFDSSAADKAGLEQGDVITEINDREIVKSAEVLEAIARQRPGDQIDIVARRNGKQLDLNATLLSREGTTKRVSKERGEVLSMLGAEFDDIDRATERKLNIDGGVRVTQLHAGILSQQTDMREGFIITKVNKESVQSVKEFMSMMENQKGGVMLEGVYEDIKGTYYYAFGL